VTGQANASTRITLYVASDAPNSVAAALNLKTALAEHPGHDVIVEIVDVVMDPDRGFRDGVLVTPMLVRVAPLPERRILGNLHNATLLLTVLGFAADDV
jgi:circadian clock protein KaiB